MAAKCTLTQAGGRDYTPPIANSLFVSDLAKDGCEMGNRILRPARERLAQHF